MGEDSLGDRQHLVPLKGDVGHRESPRLPPPIPDHDLLRCVGRGSYGEVWLARNAMGIYRAVKIVDRLLFNDRKPFDRELSGIRKFEPVSRSHEGLVDVLHVGLDDTNGFFYYVMELGDDLVLGQNVHVETYAPRTLAKDITTRGKLPWQECLELGIALSHALAELHKNSLVHRDVKPSNIIFVNGIPKLADIGLVADVSEARSYVGTEGFIPPEGPGTRQGDVYGLGKVLYEASTGFDRQEFPTLPNQWDTSPERDRFLELNEVILHACHHDATRRYQRAWDMHADLLVLANGKSVKRLRKLERRVNQAKRLAFISVAALVVLGPIGYSAYRERRSKMESRQREVGASVAYGTRSMDEGDLMGSLPYFAQALTLDESSPLNQTRNRLRFGSILAQCPKLVQMLRFPVQIDEATFSPDGQGVLVVKLGGKAQVFSTLTGNPLSKPFGQEQGVRQADFSPDGELVVTCSEDGPACVWRLSDGAEVVQLDHPGKVIYAAFSHDGKRIVTAGLDGVARICNARSGEIEHEFRGHSDPVLCSVFSPDDARIATTSRDGTARIWDVQTELLVGRPFVHIRWVDYVSFNHDGTQIITACEDHKARVWKVETGERVVPDLDHQDNVTTAMFSPDGRFILTGSLDGTARMWRTEDHQPCKPNPVFENSDRVTFASFSRDCHRIIASCIDGTVRVWDLAGGIVAPASVQASFSPDGNRYLNVTNNGIRICDTITGKQVSPVIQAEAEVEKAGLSEDGRFLFTISPENKELAVRVIKIWETSSGRRIGETIKLPFIPERVLLSSNGASLFSSGEGKWQTWAIPTRTVSAAGSVSDTEHHGAVFNPQGDTIAIWDGNQVKVWSLAKGRWLFEPFSHPFPVRSVEFSPDGTRLVTGGADALFTKCYAQEWDAVSGLAVGSRMQHRDGVVWVTFSRDGRRIATAGEDFKAIVWDASDGKRLTAAMPHGHEIWSTTFDDGGRWLVTASSDKTARVWNADTGAPLTPPLRHVRPLRSGRVLSDGTHLVTFDSQTNAYVWELQLEQKPVRDLLGIARVLTSDRHGPADVPSDQLAESLWSEWQRLRTNYPSMFETRTAEVERWEEFQAQESENEGEWFSAAFHLEQLLTKHPDDLLLKQRLDHARDQCRLTNQPLPSLR